MHFDPIKSKGIVWRDPAAAKGVLARYRQSGKNLLHFVWDWDGTIVPVIGSTWHTMRNALPPEGQAKHRALYKHYKPLEDVGKLTGAKEREWSEKALALHVEYKTPIKSLEHEAAKVQVRQYATEAFAVCEAANTPVVILSAGVRDVIAMTAYKNDMHSTAILGAELRVENDKIVGWEAGSIVDANTKREMGHPGISETREHYPHAVLYGDQPQDAGMLAGTALRIRVNGDHKVGTAEWKSYLEESWRAGYDCVLKEIHLKTAAQLNKWLIND